MVLQITENTTTPGEIAVTATAALSQVTLTINPAAAVGYHAR